MRRAAVELLVVRTGSRVVIAGQHRVVISGQVISGQRRGLTPTIRRELNRRRAIEPVIGRGQPHFASRSPCGYPQGEREAKSPQGERRVANRHHPPLRHDQCMTWRGSLPGAAISCAATSVTWTQMSAVT
jgi:hypothetical protein